jgi:hypothetical protein
LAKDEEGFELQFGKEKARKLATIPTRFAALDETTRQDLVNLGYAIAGAAILEASAVNEWEASSFLIPQEPEEVRIFLSDGVNAHAIYLRDCVSGKLNLR